MHRILVDEKRWVSETRFLHALNYCMLLPGPEAQQLATYIGWLMHKTWGGIVAGLLFILPGFVLMSGIAVAYVIYGDLSWMQGLLFGMQAATLAIVVEAVTRVGKKALKHRALYVLAGASFVAIFAFGAPFPLIVLAAGVIGTVGSRLGPRVFLPVAKPGAAVENDAVPDHAHPGMSWTLRVLLSGVLLWGGPIAMSLATSTTRSCTTVD
jgi:chromate transporter